MRCALSSNHGISANRIFGVRYVKSHNPFIFGDFVLVKPLFFCFQLLTMDQLRLFEYRRDVHYYYSLSYGYEINKKMGCGAINNMLAQLDSPTKATVFFAHQGILKVFLTTFGAFENKEPLKADNYHKMADRLFKVSLISPLAANFAAVKYKGDKIKFFHNEKILKVDGCAKDGVCDWKVVKEKFTAQCSEQEI